MLNWVEMSSAVGGKNLTRGKVDTRHRGPRIFTTSNSEQVLIKSTSLETPFNGLFGILILIFKQN